VLSREKSKSLLRRGRCGLADQGPREALRVLRPACWKRAQTEGHSGATPRGGTPPPHSLSGHAKLGMYPLTLRERIRTYNFPQGRVSDHRVNLTLHRLPAVLEATSTS